LVDVFNSYKYYVIELTEIQPRCWIGPIILILLNYLRVNVIGGVQLKKACHHMESHHADDYEHTDDHHDDHQSSEEFRRSLSSNGDDVSYHLSHICEDYVISYALVAAGALVIIGTILAFLTWQSKKKLLLLAGIQSEAHIARYLEEEKKKANKRPSGTQPEVQSEPSSPQTHLDGNRRSPVIKTHSSLSSSESGLNIHPLERADSNNRTQTILSRPTRQGSALTLTFQQEYPLTILRVMLHAQKKHKEDEKHKWLHTYHHLLNLMHVHICRCAPSSNGKPAHSTVPIVERINSLKLRARVPTSFSLDRNTKTQNSTDKIMKDIEMAPSDPEDPRLPEEDSDHESLPSRFSEFEAHPLAQNFHHVFLFSNKELYEFLIQEMLLLDSLFLALWATNFITISLHSSRPIEFNLLLLIPIFIMTGLNFIILFFSSVLFALTSLQNQGAEWLCEQDDMTQKVLPALRKEIMEILPDGAFDRRIDELFELIASMNEVNEGGISRDGFAQFLQVLNLHPSEKEIRALFRYMDKDDR
jgi:hypothetical protein